MQHHRASVESNLRRGRARRRRARAPRVLVVAALGAGATACDLPPETTAYAHESPPFDTPPAIDGPPMAALQHSTYLGGTGVDEVTAAVATGGTYPQVFVAGGTSSADFPITTSAGIDTTPTAGCSACPSDAFVTRLEGPGRIVWSTAIGGAGFERASAVVAALNGDLFVGGSAASLPVTTGAADQTFAGGSTAERGEEDGFVCRLDGANGLVRWCNFVGGNGSGGVTGLAYDPDGDDVLVVLNTVAAESLDGDAGYNAAFAGRHRATAQGADTVLVRLSGNGQSFEWATYVGGSGDESGTPSVAVSSTGVHVLTTTTSTDAPTPGGRITTAPAGRNAYLATYSLDGTSLTYGTYLGGAGDDWAPPHALFAAQSVVAAVNTTSSDMPVMNAAQATYGGGDPSAECGAGDGWVGVVLPGSTGAASLPHATYVGGSLGDEIGGLTKLGTGEIVVSGHTFSTDFPTSATYLPYQATLRGTSCAAAAGNPNSDGFVVRYEAGIDPPLVRRRIATYIGGTVADRFVVASAPGNGDFHAIAGATSSTNFPVRLGFQPVLRGPRDGIVCAPEYWREVETLNDDIIPSTDGSMPGVDAGNAIDEGDGGGCCGAGGGGGGRGASSAALALVVLALVARLTSRGRRARAGTASARDRGAP